MVASKELITKVFAQEPRPWGLRGDPMLWQELKKHFSNHLPSLNINFSKQFKEAFKQLIGEELLPDKEIFVERYNKGGMSGGFVSTNFWITQGLPHIEHRIDEEKAGNRIDGR